MIATQDIPGYRLEDRIYESQKSLVFRARRISDDLPVVIKLAAEPFTQERNRKFEHEHELNQLLPCEYCVKTIELGEERGRRFLVLEDFGGVSLSSLIYSSTLSFPAALAYAVRAAELIGQIHEQNIIHKDIKPHNFIVNPSLGLMKLTDFGISVRLSQESSRLQDSDQIEGTLAYISPEQTGRVNSEFDHRTDLYSLGVALYELFSGKRPFDSADAMELIHSHIARTPSPPHSMYTHEPLPDPLTAIILKLLAKSPDDRYQSAFGVQKDLQACLDQFVSNGRIDPFALGRSDFTNRIRISNKLYGRDREIAALSDAFARVCAGSTELVLVEGYSGIGKTALVNELREDAARQGAYFIHGKFDQYQRAAPYAAIGDAFDELISAILKEPGASFESWRDEIQRAVGDLGRAVLAVIPKFKSLLGAQSEIPELGPIESQNRFSQVFHRLLSAIATRQHPLVVFLDDLQWIDPASLDLVASLLVEHTPKSLMIIGAYRKNEVDDAHPLALRLSEFRSHGLISETIAPENLTARDVQALISDTFSPCENDDELVQLIHSKTQGNPFFVHRLLRSLCESAHIRFSRITGGWRWDRNAAEALEVSMNVVDLLTKEICNLSPQTQQLLIIGACIGSSFHVETLRTVVPLSDDEFDQTTRSAISGQMVVKNNADLRFVHDRVQQAAYGLIDEAERAEVHAAIGRALLKAHPTDDSGMLFSIVDQLNSAGEVISEPSERLLLARLNLRAGRKARASSAHRTALGYLSAGIARLPGDGWSVDPGLTFALHEESAQCQYVAGEFDAAENSFELLHHQAATELDTLRIFEAQLKLYVTRVVDATTKGQRVARRALETIGTPVPEDSEAFEELVKQERLAIEKLLRRVDVRTLVSRPLSDDPLVSAAMGILTQIWSMAYVIADAGLNAFSVLLLVRLSLEKGHTSKSSFGYVTYAMMLSIQRAYRRAYEVGSMAVELHEAIGDKDLTGRIYLNFGPNVQQYRLHLRKSTDLLRASYRASQAVGDLSYAVWAMYFEIWTEFSMGRPLAEVEKEASDLRAAVNGCKDVNMANAFGVLECALRVIQDDRQDSPVFVTDAGDEGSVLEGWRSQHFFAAVNWLLYLKAQILYLDCAYEEAFQLLREAQKTEGAHFASYPITQFNFLYGLAICAVWDSLPESERGEQNARLENQLVLLRLLADSCPENFFHMKELLEAEKARIGGDAAAAIQSYHRAMQSASENHYVQNEGIAYERAGLFLYHLRMNDVAYLYIREAYVRYRRWGAKRKTKQLEIQFPALRLDHRRTSETTTSSASTTGASTDVLEFSSILKASQALSGEIVLASLLEKMMAIVLENAGAEFGALILPWKRSWAVRATKRLGEPIHLVDGLSVPESGAAPESAVNYVLRGRQPLVLTTAAGDFRFARDPYILSKQPKSVLCFPVERRETLCAVLYLENNLVTGAFTEERLEVLGMLSAQIAISLENAELHESLENRVRDRTADLMRTLDELKAVQSQLLQTEKMAVLGKLAAGVAHELNTPLGAMLGSLDTVRRCIDRVTAAVDQSPHLAESGQGQVLRQTVDILRGAGNAIMSSGQRMSRAVNSLKSFARLDKSEFELADLHEGIRCTLDLIRYEMGEGVSVECVFGILPRIYCNPGGLNQVFLTLFQSALERLNHCGTITISTHCDTSTVFVSIRDSGAGIAQDTLQRIFEPSFSSVAGRVTAHLGLPAAYDLVKQHGGELSAQSRIGAGCEYLITLPIRDIA
jgi:predicted ATPase/signal transduction histidine kinase